MSNMMSSMMPTSFAPPAMPASASAVSTTRNLPEASEKVENPKPRVITRSRSGCYTCRVRRKKCDEERPSCKACKKLCLKCDYKPPQWWVSVESRRIQKERIKNRIRQTKTMEKHGSLQEYMERIRALTQRPQRPAAPAAPAAQFDFNQPVLNNPINQYNYNPFAAPLLTPATPYNPNTQTDHNAMLTNVPLPYGASMSTLNAMAPLPQIHVTSPMTTPVSAGIDWSQMTPGYAQPSSIINPAGLPPKPLSADFETMVPLNDHDRPLLDHFIDKVLHLVYPIAEIHPQGPAQQREIMKSLQMNRSYLHCCLSVSAIDLKNGRGLTDQMDHDIMHHRYEAISHLCRTLNGKPSNEKVLNATLAMIFYNSSVGETEDHLPDIPWNAHFKAVTSLANSPDCALTQFNVSLITWIDILGATMLGTTPCYSHTYRTKHLNGITSGLQQLMGCDDRIMYLISEIACLESLRLEGRIDDMSLSQHVTALNAQLEWAAPVDGTLETPYSLMGEVQPEKLTKNITAIFRTAARIYLHSLMPGFDCYEPINITSVGEIAEALQFLPVGPNGFDRCLVWPLFIAGVASAPYSGYRKILTDRVVAMGYLSNFGNIGRMYRVLQALWKQSDPPVGGPSTNTAPSQDGLHTTAQENLGFPQGRRMHWRDLMQNMKWDYLLM